MYTKKVVEKSFEHTKMEKSRLKKAICRGVVDSLNGVLNIFEHFDCYTKSIIVLLLIAQLMSKISL